LTGWGADSVSELPEGWIWTSIGSICCTSSGGTPSRKNLNYYGGNIPWLKSGELNDGNISQSEEFITEQGLNNSSAKINNPDTLLIALYGATVGKLGILTIAASTNQAICAITLPDELYTRFIFWYLKSIRRNLLNSRIGGAQPNISQQIIRNLEIPIPPLPEQHRIVAKIEELFTRLDAGVAALTKAKALLKRYRQSVLKAAVEGRLTEEWRKENGERIESPSVLLERIQAERKQRLGKNYKPPRPIDTSNLPELPDGWAWAPLINAAMLHRGYDLPVQNRINGIYPVVASSSIVGYHNKKMIDGPGVITGRSGTIGEVIYIDSDYWPLNTTLYVCDFNGNLPRFIYYLLKSIRLQKYLAGTGVPTLNRNIVHPTLVPLPPVSEQVIIANFLANYFSIIDESEQIIDAELKRSQSLRQSILKRAFAGKLVPQDPNDEPASVFLEKIRKEKKI